jgi:O-antigen/teichoic acid export membrane protein
MTGDGAPTPAARLPAATPRAAARRAERTGSPLRAGVLSIVHHGVTQVIRVGSHLILAKLLSVEAFGLMGIVNSLTTAVELFSDLGIGQKIVQSPRGDDPAFLNTAWTLKSLRGIVLWLATLLLAWPVARFYGVDVLAVLVPVVGFGAVLSGFGSTAIHSRERRLDLGRLVSLQVTGQVLGGVVMIVWALLAPSVWSLAVGLLTSALVVLVGSHVWLSGVRNRFQWDRESVSEVLRFGRWMLPATIVYYCLTLSHRLILGKFVTAEVLGLFNIAAFLAGFVPQTLGAVSARVLFPLFARREESVPHAVFLQQIGRARRGLLALALPLVCVLVVWGPEIVGLLYDDRYLGAGWMVHVLAMGSIVECVNGTSTILLLSLGDAKLHCLALAGAAVLFAMFVVAGYLLRGWQGIVVAVAAAPLARYPALAWALHRHAVWQPLLDLSALIGAGGVLGAFWLLKAILA